MLLSLVLYKFLSVNCTILVRNPDSMDPKDLKWKEGQFELITIIAGRMSCITHFKKTKTKRKKRKEKRTRSLVPRVC